MNDLKQKLNKAIKQNSKIPNYPHNIIVPIDVLNYIKEEFSDNFSITSVGKRWSVCGYEVQSVSFSKAKKSFLLCLVDYSKKLIEEHKQTKSNTIPHVITGKYTVKGIIKNKSVRDVMGVSIDKMVVQFPNQTTAYGSMPAGSKKLEIGDEIVFQASFEASNDPTHAVFKYPVLKDSE